MPRVFKNMQEWLGFRKTLARHTVGFVPTMGALHEGHASLLQRAHDENDYSVLSIYVNPTQFNNLDDLEKYPATLENDLRMAEKIGIDFVLLPSYKEIYPDGYRYRVTENEFSKTLCGAHRPGHFDGVLTVVMKLFNLVQPTRAYFGEKDHQQLELIRSMASTFFMPLKVVGCPTVRESDGLAMSSRNVRLSSEARTQAANFSKALRESATPEEAAQFLTRAGFKVDYVEDMGSRRYGAVFLNDVRLIDNVER